MEVIIKGFLENREICGRESLFFAKFYVTL